MAPLFVINIQLLFAQQKEYFISRFDEDVRISNFLKDGGMGRSLSYGDINGDGITDFLVGSDHIIQRYLAGGGAFLVFGKQNFSRFLDLENARNRVLFWGNGEQNVAGSSVEILDFNRDKNADIFISAPELLSSQNNFGEGKIHYLQGRATWPDEIILEDYPADGLSATIHGDQPNAHIGMRTAKGDFNGDGFQDLSTISWFANRDAPRDQQASVYIVWGGQKLVNAPINSNLINQCTVIPPEEKQTGMVVFAGNLDEDAFDELIIMLTDASVDTVEWAGSGFILWGQKNWPKRIDLGDWQNLQNVTRLLEQREGAHAFTSLAIGDFDGSGKNDMAITTFVGSGYRPGFVHIYIDPFLKKERMFNLDDPTKRKIVITDRHLKSNGFPYLLANLDWNHDGIADLAITNPKGAHVYDGTVYLVFGSKSLPDTIDFKSKNADYLWIHGGSESMYLGMSVAGADVNGDRKDDLILGAWTAATKKGGDSSGEVYVFFNRETEIGLPVPTEINLLPVMPNPVSANTVIFFELPQQSNIKLEIYDILGRKVRTLRDGLLGPGRFSAIWNTKDDAATDLASGVYFAVLRTDQTTLKRKLLLIH